MDRTTRILAKRYALIVAILDYAVEIGNGIAPAIFPDGQRGVFNQDDVDRLATGFSEWVVAVEEWDGDHPEFERFRRLVSELGGLGYPSRQLILDKMDLTLSPREIH